MKNGGTNMNQIYVAIKEIIAEHNKIWRDISMANWGKAPDGYNCFVLPDELINIIASGLRRKGFVKEREETL